MTNRLHTITTILLIFIELGKGTLTVICKGLFSHFKLFIYYSQLSQYPNIVVVVVNPKE